MKRRTLSIIMLLGLILVAQMYSGIIYSQATFATAGWVEGAFGVMLGLFICSRPAAHLLDLLYRSYYAGPPKLWIWISLNLITLLVGVIVVFIGVMQFTRSTVGH